MLPCHSEDGECNKVLCISELVEKLIGKERAPFPEQDDEWTELRQNYLQMVSKHFKIPSGAEIFLALFSGLNVVASGFEIASGLPPYSAIPAMGGTHALFTRWRVARRKRKESFAEYHPRSELLTKDELRIYAQNSVWQLPCITEEHGRILMIDYYSDQLTSIFDALGRTNFDVFAPVGLGSVASMSGLPMHLAAFWGGAMYFGLGSVNYEKAVKRSDAIREKMIRNKGFFTFNMLHANLETPMPEFYTQKLKFYDEAR